MTSQPTARATATIHLGAIAANWLAMTRLTRARTGAVVKADAYGHGMEPVARALAAAGCRDFFTAHGAEAISLRRALGPEPGICVLNGAAPGEETTLAQAGLLVTLNSPAQLAAWRDACPGAPFALMIDTGMNRLGLRGEDLGLVDGLRPALVMSHLACADEPDHPLNAGQLSRFSALSARFAGVARSLANSAGAMLGPDWHFDLLRPGIALYGGGPDGAVSLRPGMTLTAPVLSVFTAQAGESVGYGASARIDRQTRLATVGLGYGDGFPRSASGRGYGLLRGVRCPIMGRVSMDLITLDVSAVAGDIAPGEPVELFGSGIHLEGQARRAGTLGYELVSGLTPRVRRVYEDAA